MMKSVIYNYRKDNIDLRTSHVVIYWLVYYSCCDISTCVLFMLWYVDLCTSHVV